MFASMFLAGLPWTPKEETGSTVAYSRDKIKERVRFDLLFELLAYLCRRISGFRMSGFSVCFEEDGVVEILARLNFAAVVPGRPVVVCNDHDGQEDSKLTKSVVCLTNTSGEGSITWGGSSPSILPRLHELRRLPTTHMRWHSSLKAASNHPMKPDIVLLLDLPESSTLEHHEAQSCILS